MPQGPGLAGRNGVGGCRPSRVEGRGEGAKPLRGAAKAGVGADNPSKRAGGSAGRRPPPATTLVAAPPRPYRAFLGNGGTNFLAILFCAFLLDGVDSGRLSPGAAPLLALLPLTEITFTFARRLAQRQSPFVADRGHLHHMALSAGWSPRRTAATYLLICLCSTATGLLMGARSDGLLWTLAAVALSLAAATGVLVGRSHGFPVLAKEMRP